MKVEHLNYVPKYIVIFCAMYPVSRVLKEAALLHFSAIKLQETPERDPGTMLSFYLKSFLKLILPKLSYKYILLLYSLTWLLFFFFYLLFRNLYPKFASPWASSPCRPQDIGRRIYLCLESFKKRFLRIG